MRDFTGKGQTLHMPEHRFKSTEFDNGLFA
jgi:hypothetical protein